MLGILSLVEGEAERECSCWCDFLVAFIATTFEVFSMEFGGIEEEKNARETGKSRRRGQAYTSNLLEVFPSLASLCASGYCLQGIR